VPWRAKQAEAMLKGQPFNEDVLTAAANKAFEDAHARTHNAYKIELGKRTLVRALHQAAALEI
jgi:xanthine dehydrogenase YagS FAD-binding subunit